ncbi:MAG TPA: NAD(P)-dependent oxidoreductase [Armatimonadota bacterium]|nr:NAD(P)-dependent oxidoreductase [Armatimonadota bacterium]
MSRKRMIGFIGLGAMGTPMANRLLDAGWKLIVYDRKETACRVLVLKGAAIAVNPREVAEKADIVLTMLSDDNAVRDAAFGDNGIFAGLGEGKILADISTTSLGLALDLEAAASGVGAKSLDVRVSGSIDHAQTGDLLILVGGNSQVLERVRPVLEVLGKKIIHTGGHGTAASVKIALNILLGLEMQALAETMVLARKSGIAPLIMSEVITSSGLASPLIISKLKQIHNNDFNLRFALKYMQKDLGLALDEGQRLNVPMPAVASVNEVAKAGIAAGYGDIDCSVLYLVIAQMSGLQIETTVSDTQALTEEPAHAI